MRGAITILLLALAGLPARATEYAVAPGGLDGNSGLPDSPWRTLQKAADTLNAGDTVVVADGSYDGFVARNSGSSGSPIVFRAANPGGALIDAPSGDAVGEELDHHVAIRGKSYIVVDGFEVAGAPKAGILVRSLTDTTGTDTRGVVVRNCVVHGNGTSASAGHDGIRAVLAREFAADGNEVYGNAAHGIAVLGGADGPALRRNKVHENGLDGIRLDGNLSLGGDGTISFWLVERNEVYGHPGGDALGLDGAAQGIAQNNLLYRNGQRGIHLYVQNGAAASASNLVVNNTVYNPSASGAALRLADGANNNVAFNNLLYTTFGTGISAGAVSGFSHDYNTFTNISGGAQAAHEFLNPPGAVFTDTAADDYTLKAGSPALNSGALEFSGTGAPGEDLQGTTRPFGAGIDRGAFEQGPPPDTSPPGVTILFPTLGTKYTTVAETTALSGAANDDRGVALVTWSNDAGGSGFALGTVSWSVPNVALALGPNVITVMALDAAGNTGSDTLTVTRLPPPNQPPVLGTGPLAAADPVLLPAGGDLLVTASDPDGGPEPLTYTWSFVGGPAAATFAPNGGEDADQTVATFGAPGVYQLRVAVSDGQDETSAELYVTASDGSVPGAVDGAALHLTKGSYSINFQRDNADRLLLAGRFRRDALPADPGGIAVSCFLNGSLFAPAQALDSIGRYASPRGETPALRYQFKPADGSFSLNASSADLAPLLNPANRTGKGAHLIHVRLRLEGGGLGAPLEAQGAFAFTFNSSRDRSSRGAFNFAKDPVFDGAFAVTRATAKALPDPQGGGFKLTLSGGIAPRGGGPLQLVDELVNNADLRIVLDGHAIEVSFHTLRVSPAEFAKRSFTFNPRSFGIVPPDLQALRFSNANRTFAVTSKGLLDTGIPPAGDGQPLAYPLPVRFELETLQGLLVFETVYELRRTKATLGSWR